MKKLLLVCLIVLGGCFINVSAQAAFSFKEHTDDQKGKYAPECFKKSFGDKLSDNTNCSTTKK